MSSDSVTILVSLMDKGATLYEAEPAPVAVAASSTAVDAGVVQASPTAAAAMGAETTATSAPPLRQHNIDLIIRSARKTHRTAVKTQEAHERIAVMPLSSYLAGET